MTSWILFFVIIAIAFIIDALAHSKKEATRVKEALIWTCFWIALALGFNAWIYFAAGKEAALNFFTAYLVEKTLSIDNLFVFLVIFKAFAIPPTARHKVLFWGILGAFVMRALFIAGGILLLAKFHWLLYVFGAFLIYSGIKLMKAEKTEADPEKNPIVIWLQRWFPVVHDSSSKTFFVKKE